jgi:hypothetical protein
VVLSLHRVCLLQCNISYIRYVSEIPKNADACYQAAASTSIDFLYEGIAVIAFVALNHFTSMQLISLQLKDLLDCTCACSNLSKMILGAASESECQTTDCRAGASICITVFSSESFNYVTIVKWQQKLLTATMLYDRRRAVSDGIVNALKIRFTK